MAIWGGIAKGLQGMQAAFEEYQKDKLRNEAAKRAEEELALRKRTLDLDEAYKSFQMVAKNHEMMLAQDSFEQGERRLQHNIDKADREHALAKDTYQLTKAQNAASNALRARQIGVSEQQAKTKAAIWRVKRKQTDDLYATNQALAAAAQEINTEPNLNPFEKQDKFLDLATDIVKQSGMADPAKVNAIIKHYSEIFRNDVIPRADVTTMTDPKTGEAHKYVTFGDGSKPIDLGKAPPKGLQTEDKKFKELNKYVSSTLGSYRMTINSILASKTEARKQQQAQEGIRTIMDDDPPETKAIKLYVQEKQNLVESMEKAEAQFGGSPLAHVTKYMRNAKYDEGTIYNMTKSLPHVPSHKEVIKVLNAFIKDYNAENAKTTDTLDFADIEGAVDGMLKAYPPSVAQYLKAKLVLYAYEEGIFNKMPKVSSSNMIKLEK